MGSTIFLFLLCFLAFQALFALGDIDLIKKTCKNTKYYDLCVSSLKSNASSSTVDTKGLALIMVGIGTANATATSLYLSSELVSSTNDAILRKVLKECADKYTFAGNALQDSIQDLTLESYDYAYLHVMAASDYPNACHNVFKSYPGLAYLPEIGRREDGLKRICDVVLGIIDSIGW